ncbi:MAG: hypothetical protein CL666_11615 [Balneola sp.]|nr:hypothetical protein [Balneola sp.]|tara:strand:- start:14088 stop:14855 length:768 start_codon:yes stop_codon:yes gene_type:complete
MTRLFIFLSLLFFVVQPAIAQQSPQAIFDEANTLLQEGELNEALNRYRSVSATGQESGALYLNMGITALRLDSMGIAKYYFLKAQEFETTREQADQALEYVNAQFSRQSALLPKLPWDRAVEWINTVPGASGLFVLGFLLTLSGLILLYGCWFGSFQFSSYSSFIISLIIAGTVVGGLAFYADYVDQRYHHAVLVDNSQRVYETSNPEGTLVSIAYEGYDLTVDNWKSNDVENWLYVRLGNGQFGWIRNEGVKKL